MSEATNSTEGESVSTEGAEAQQGTTFTPAEVEKIVRDRLAQQAKNKFGDYEEQKSKAATAATLEERLGALESELGTTRAEALRTRIAAKFNISTEPGKDGEPSDADLFLTGADEATLTSQAQRLASRVADRKKQGNVASKEGETKTSGSTDTATREFAAQLFGSAD